MGEEKLLTELKVLVVEDHTLQRTVLMRLIEAEGVASVRGAAGGIEALQILREQPIDIVFCDLDMPDLDGLGVVRGLVDEKHAVAFALLSAVEPVVLDCVELMTESQPIRFLGAVEKPVTSAQLRALLESDGKEPRRGEPPPPRPLTEILRGFEAGELCAYFQPIVDAKTGALRSAEALARWEHPEAGTLSPATFLSALEAHDGADALTWVVLDDALKFILATREEGLDLSVSVNLSAGFLGREHVAEEIAEKLLLAGVAPSKIAFELTEGVALSSVINALENLARLRMRGHRLVIDDFGTEYASLRQLVRVPFQVMKLDHHFVREAMGHERAFGVLRSAVAMARELSMSTVIEGVETDEVRERLGRVECDMHQGYLYSRAIRTDEFIRWAKQRAAEPRPS